MKHRSFVPDEIDQSRPLKISQAYKTYHDFAIGKVTPKKTRKFKKVAYFRKLSPVLEEELAKKPKRAKKLDPAKQTKTAKKSSTVQTAGVVIRDAPECCHFFELFSLRNPQEKAKAGFFTCFIQVAQWLMELVPNQSRDDDSNDDDSDDVSNDDDDVDCDANGDNEASDSDRTNFDEDENPNLNQNDDEEEEYKEEYVRTPKNYEFTDDEEEYEELYKDVNVRLKDAKHEKEGKGDAEMTDVGRDDVSQKKSYEQVKDDAHVTLTAAHVTHKTEIISMMNVKVRHEDPSIQTSSLLTIPVLVIPETTIVAAPTIPSTILPITPHLQQSTPTPAPTTDPTTTLIPAFLDFSSLFVFDQRVHVLEKELAQLKQADQST
ncbi:hypothetical protein Tco_0478355 [Tanacetum coccineum]